MKIDKLQYNKEYIGGLKASVDWIAGGNFDGYISRTTLKFLEGNYVIRRMTIIDSSRYDGIIKSNEQIGSVIESDKSTLTCKFENFEMRGKILGEGNNFIAFSVIYPNHNFNNTECYEIENL